MVVQVAIAQRPAVVGAHIADGIERAADVKHNDRKIANFQKNPLTGRHFVYATDAALMKDKVRIAMDVPLDVAITYPVATLAGSAHGDAARQFVAYVLSPAGQAILGKYGFQKP